MLDLPLASPARQAPVSRWLPTVLVTATIAFVVLGGIGLDGVIAAPSAGTVAVGGPVTITAAPGWVLGSPGDRAAGIELQKSNAILTAEVVASSYSGEAAAMLTAQEDALSGESAQISYGDLQRTSVSGHETAFVAFEATIVSGGRSGVIDGELICMIVDGNVVVILVGAPQGDLDPVIDDVTAMLASVGVAR